MSRKSGLGRGLDALIQGSDNAPETGGVMTLLVGQIASNPRQPRERFDPDGLAELAESIRQHGVLQPLIVTSGEQPDSYVLIAGERRLLAARQAGLERVPVLVRTATDLERIELALIENVQRADLNPLEAAEAYRQLAEDFSLSHEQIASRVAKSRVAVTNTLRLLKLPESARQALREGRISEGHGRALLALPTAQAQAAALQTILTLDLNVRQSEALVKKLTGQRPAKPPQPTPDPQITALQDRLETWLNTRVSLTPHGKQGTITIYYYSDEELETLIDRLLGENS